MGDDPWFDVAAGLHHRNICNDATDTEDARLIYKRWGSELKKLERGRKWNELFSVLVFCGSIAAYGHGDTELALGIAIISIAFLLRSIRFMIDASNTDFLLHQWDLNERLRWFSMNMEQRLATSPKQYFIGSDYDPRKKSEF